MITNDWLAKRADLTPDKVAIIDTITGTEVTYRQWNLRANRTARWLQDGLGVRKGDRVAVLAMNCMDYLDIWFGLGKIGGILQNLNWRQAVPELQAIIADAGPTALIYSGDFAVQIQTLQPQLPLIHRWIALDATASPDHESFSQRDHFPDTSLSPFLFNAR